MVQTWVTNELQFAALAEVLKVLRQEPVPEVLVQATVDYVVQDFASALIWIARYDSSSKTLVGMGGKISPDDPSLFRQKITLAAGDRFDQALVQKHLVNIPDLRQENHVGSWQKTAQKAKIQGAMIYPLHFANTCLGVVLLGSTRWGQLLKNQDLARLSIVLDALAASLYHVQATTIQSEQSQPETGGNWPEFLQQVHQQPSVDQKLLRIVQDIQQTLNPSRTCLYWWYPQQQCFLRRLQAQPKITGGRRGSMGAVEQHFSLARHEISSFANALDRGQLVAISELQSNFNAAAPLRLMQQLHLQSLLAAPILFEGKLLGFLTAEVNNPHLWSEPEKQYLQVASQVMTLVAPLGNVEENHQQEQQQKQLLLSLSQAILTEQTWQETFKQTANQLCQELGLERVLLLQYHPETNTFAIPWQHHMAKLRPLPNLLKALGASDQERLSYPTVAIENIQTEAVLLPWQEVFLQAGMRAILCCNPTPHGALGQILVLCQNQPRHWSQPDLQLATAVAQQLAVIDRYGTLQEQDQQQQQAYQSLQKGVKAIAQAQSVEALETQSLPALKQTLNLPLVALVTWNPGDSHGRIVVPAELSAKFALQTDYPVDLMNDPLIQRALSQAEYQAEPELIVVPVSDLPPQTRQWLSGPGIQQVMVVALRTEPDVKASGVLVCADHPNRTWSALELEVFATLLQQLSHSHRAMLTGQVLAEKYQRLEMLNWYKHRRLEELYRNLLGAGNQLIDLSARFPASLATLATPSLKHIRHSLAELPNLIKRESWRLRYGSESGMLVSMIKRSIDRVDGLLKQNQLRIQVHTQESMTLEGDIGKIDLVLYELLLAACHRLNIGGKIDIWCQCLDNAWAEISMTDNGEIDADLLIELNQDAPADWLAPNRLLQRAPGRHLQVCQHLALKLQGRLDLYKLEDGRTLTRLVLPLKAI